MLVLAGSMASAEIVFLTSGRTPSVKAHRERASHHPDCGRAGSHLRQDVVEKRPRRGAIRSDGATAQPVKTPARPSSAAPRWKVTPYTDLIVNTAQAYGVDRSVTGAVQVESNYAARRSSKGAMGLIS